LGTGLRIEANKNLPLLSRPSLPHLLYPVVNTQPLLNKLWLMLNGRSLEEMDR
jgi:hypothetical protein